MIVHLFKASIQPRRGYSIHPFLQIILRQNILQHGIESILSYKQQRRPLPSFLYLPLFSVFNSNSSVPTGKTSHPVGFWTRYVKTENITTVWPRTGVCIPFRILVSNHLYSYLSDPTRICTVEIFAGFNLYTLINDKCIHTRSAFGLQFLNIKQINLLANYYEWNDGENRSYRISFLITEGGQWACLLFSSKESDPRSPVPPL